MQVEAHRLSDQALAIHRAGYFSPLSTASTSISPEVELSSPVLLKQEETCVLDPVILSVPMPILSLSAAEKTTLGPSLFPSPAEIEENPDVASRARVALLHILNRRHRDRSRGLSEALRDLHLLVFVADLLDESSVRTICACLTGKRNKGEELSTSAMILLDLLKDGLQQTVED